MISELVHIGDILAIPFFILLSYYFIKKKNKTILEYILLIFSLCGVVADIMFTVNYLKNKPI
jgi:hypothetical protein